MINKQFNCLANVDQLWRRLAIEANIQDNIMKEAKDTCGNHWTWQQLLRSATLIERENRRLMQGTIAQMAHKIHQVREALQRQTQLLEDTQGRLELLSGRLGQMEIQNRARELERVRVTQREIRRKEDELWIKEWDEMCIDGNLDYKQTEGPVNDNRNNSSSSKGTSNMKVMYTEDAMLLDMEMDERVEPDVQEPAPVVISIVGEWGQKREGLRF
ncbi:hypothetical protein BGZ46_010681 [Entomortierella lignicola]|nr:hypothetical protein BGZ46_010681 [Entomortierella lignicola]